MRWLGLIFALTLASCPILATAQVALLATESDYSPQASDLAKGINYLLFSELSKLGIELVERQEIGYALSELEFNSAGFTKSKNKLISLLPQAKILITPQLNLGIGDSLKLSATLLFIDSSTTKLLLVNDLTAPTLASGVRQLALQIAQNLGSPTSLLQNLDQSSNFSHSPELTLSFYRALEWWLNRQPERALSQLNQILNVEENFQAAQKLRLHIYIELGLSEIFAANISANPDKISKQKNIFNIGVLDNVSPQLQQALNTPKLCPNLEIRIVSAVNIKKLWQELDLNLYQGFATNNLAHDDWLKIDYAIRQRNVSNENFLIDIVDPLSGRTFQRLVPIANKDMLVTSLKMILCQLDTTVAQMRGNYLSPDIDLKTQNADAYNPELFIHELHNLSSNPTNCAAVWRAYLAYPQQNVKERIALLEYLIKLCGQESQVEPWQILARWHLRLIAFQNNQNKNLPEISLDFSKEREVFSNQQALLGVNYALAHELRSKNDIQAAFVMFDQVALALEDSSSIDVPYQILINAHYFAGETALKLGKRNIAQLHAQRCLELVKLNRIQQSAQCKQAAPANILAISAFTLSWSPLPICDNKSLWHWQELNFKLVKSDDFAAKEWRTLDLDIERLVRQTKSNIHADTAKSVGNQVLQDTLAKLQTQQLKSFDILIYEIPSIAKFLFHLGDTELAEETKVLVSKIIQTLQDSSQDVSQLIAGLWLAVDEYPEVYAMVKNLHESQIDSEQLDGIDLGIKLISQESGRSLAFDFCYQNILSFIKINDLGLSQGLAVSLGKLSLDCVENITNPKQLNLAPELLAQIYKILDQLPNPDPELLRIKYSTLFMQSHYYAQIGQVLLASKLIKDLIEKTQTQELLLYQGKLSIPFSIYSAANRELSQWRKDARNF